MDGDLHNWCDNELSDTIAVIEADHILTMIDCNHHHFATIIGIDGAW